MKKILYFSLACIILLTTMFSINMSSVLATDASKENMYNDIVNYAKSKAKNYDKVNFVDQIEKFEIGVDSSYEKSNTGDKPNKDNTDSTDDASLDDFNDSSFESNDDDFNDPFFNS